MKQLQTMGFCGYLKLSLHYGVTIMAPIGQTNTSMFLIKLGLSACLVLQAVYANAESAATDQISTQSLKNAELIDKFTKGKYQIELHRILDQNKFAKNPDGMIFYKTQMYVTISDGNKKATNLLGDYFYTPKDYGFGGMMPAVAVDLDSGNIDVFVLSKVDKHNYAMEGFAFRKNINDNKNWTKTNVFSNQNWGWYSFFSIDTNNKLRLQHFSFDGYYDMVSHFDNKQWTTNRVQSITPDNAQKRSENQGKFLIDSVSERIQKEAEVKAKAEQAKQITEQKEQELIASLKACGSRVYDAKAGITAEDFGNCDKVNTDEFIGLILYKQGGRYFDLHCRNGEKYDYDASAKRLINNFETDKCWKALHLIPNSCEVDNYRGQCDANKKPNGVGYQRYSYAKDWLTNYQIYRGMFKDGKRDGFGSYYELAGCGLLGCTSGWSRTGNAWFKNGDKAYGECTFNLKDCESKPIRQAEQARKEQEAYDRKVANFRKNLKVGDDATAGMVIEIKGNLIKIQTNDRQCSQKDYNGKCMNYVNTPVEKWVKRSELYPY